MNNYLKKFTLHDGGAAVISLAGGAMVISGHILKHDWLKRLGKDLVLTMGINVIVQAHIEAKYHSECMEKNYCGECLRNFEDVSEEEA